MQDTLSLRPWWHHLQKGLRFNKVLGEEFGEISKQMVDTIDWYIERAQIWLEQRKRL